jgi:hypothetical protein
MIELYKDLKTINSIKKLTRGLPKRPTQKNQLIVMLYDKYIVDIIVGETVATGDIKIFIKRRSELSPTQRFPGYKAYVGELLRDTHTKRREVEILLRLKKPKINQRLKKAFFVEHLIRLVKIFRVVAEKFRLKTDNYEPVILVVCGLIRWRIGAIVMSQ